MRVTDPATIAELVDRAERIALKTEPKLACLDQRTRRRRIAEAIFRQLRQLERPVPLGRLSDTSRLPKQG